MMILLLILQLCASYEIAVLLSGNTSVTSGSYSSPGTLGGAVYNCPSNLYILNTDMWNAIGLYVIDKSNSAMRSYSPSLSSGGTLSSEATQLKFPYNGVTCNNLMGIGFSYGQTYYYWFGCDYGILKFNTYHGSFEYVIGNGTNGFAGDGTSGTGMISNIGDMIYTGNIYFSDSGNNRIRIGYLTTLQTVAGTGQTSYNGEGMAATSCNLNNPTGMAFLNGVLYFADTGNHLIRKISNGIIYNVVGVGSVSGNDAYHLNNPMDVAFDTYSNLIIADTSNRRVVRSVGTGNHTTTILDEHTYISNEFNNIAPNVSKPMAVAAWGTTVYVADCGSNLVYYLKTYLPSGQPTSQPTNPTGRPSRQPTMQPSGQPSSHPSSHPSSQPSSSPSSQPTTQPSNQPTVVPTSQPSSQPTTEPSSQPSCQPSMQPSSLPSSQPSSQPTCGTGSEIEGIACHKCSAGKYSNEHNSEICIDCPIGTYTSVRDSVFCIPCTGLSSTVSTGSTSCDAIYVNIKASGIISVFVLVIISYFSLIYYSNETAWMVIAFSAVPFMDVYSDLQYILSGKFYNVTIFVLVLLVFMFANLLFLFNIFYKMKAYPAIQQFPGYYLIGSNIIWLKAVGGQPYVNGNKFKYSLEEHDGMEKLLYYWFVWIGLLFAQISYLFIVYPLWIVVYSVFLCLWLLVVFFLFQTKLLAISKLWNIWFSVWTQSNAFNKTVNIDIAIIHESTLHQFLLETMPQLVLQCTNGYISNIFFTPTSLFSILFSILIILNSFYRYGYYLLWKKKSFGDIPLPLTLKVTKLVSNVNVASVRDILMSRLVKKRSDDSCNIVTLLTALNDHLEEYTSLSKLDILYILLFAINIEEVTDTLHMEGVTSAGKLMNNVGVVKLLAHHLDKIISYYASNATDSNETSNNYISFYKKIKQSMFLLTDVVPEVDITPDSNNNSDEAGSDISNASNYARHTEDDHLRQHAEIKGDYNCEYDDIYALNSSNRLSQMVENPLRKSNC